MDLKDINFYAAQQRAKSIGVKLSFSSNLFADFNLDAMDDQQRWIWTGEEPAKPASDDRTSLLSELLDLKALLSDFDAQLRTA